MRMLPFFKPKKGFVVAGGGLDAGGGGGGGGSYTLPTATASRLGGVKIGSGVSVADDGTISVSGGGGGTLTQRTETITSGSTLHDVATIPVETNKTYIISSQIGWSNNETKQMIIAYGDQLEDYEIYAEGKSHVSLAFTSRVTGNLHIWCKQDIKYSGNTETCYIDVFEF